MTYFQDLAWPEVFATWSANEESNPSWQKVAREVKGWPDWRSWRLFTIGQLKLDQREWKLFRLDDPMQELSSLLLGPYSGWQSRVPKPNEATFADLVNIPEQHEYYTQHTMISTLQKNFPVDTQLMGLRRPDGKIVCIDGHHRALAAALAKRDGTPMRFGEVRMAIANLGPGEESILDSTLARGTTKDPR